MCYQVLLVLQHGSPRWCTGAEALAAGPPPQQRAPLSDRTNFQHLEPDQLVDRLRQKTKSEKSLKRRAATLQRSDQAKKATISRLGQQLRDTQGQLTAAEAKLAQPDPIIDEVSSMGLTAGCLVHAAAVTPAGNDAGPSLHGRAVAA